MSALPAAHVDTRRLELIGIALVAVLILIEIVFAAAPFIR